MISKIIMPNLGATGGDVILQEWLVKPGEVIQAGQPLFVVITDKASVEVEAFRSGVLREVHISAGETVSLGAVLGLLSDSIDEPLDQPAVQVIDGLPRLSHAEERDVAFLSPLARLEGRIFASPLARRIASEVGLDLANLSGSGAHGQVLKRDVQAALEAAGAFRKSAGQKISQAGIRREPLSLMQRAIAERTQRSKSQIPHYYATITVDMGAAQDLRRLLADWVNRFGWTVPSYTDLCLCAAALALKDFPTLNASFAGDAILYHGDINVGIVVGLETGMLVPVIQEADRLSLFELAAETKRLRGRAEEGQLSEREITGGTFTLSNLGMYGLDSFIAVINPPEAGILALGAIKEQPANFNGGLALRPLMTASLSVDHRVVDGITAAKFLQVFKDFLEKPALLLLEPPDEVTPP